MRLHIGKGLWMPLAMTVFSLILMNHGFSQDEFHIRSYMFSNTVSIAMLILSVLWLLGELIGAISTRIEPVPWRPVIGGLVLTALYVWLVPWIGLWMSSLLLWLIVVVAYDADASGLRTMWGAVLTGGLFMLTLYLLFNYFLQIQTPKGALNLI